MPSLYIEALSNFKFGFATVTVLALLNHLDSTYGTVTAVQLNANLEALQLPYDPTAPIETIWTQFAHCQQFTANEDAINNALCICTACNLFHDAGHYQEAVRTWRSKSTPDQTLANFKVHFNSAEVEWCLELTSSQAGFLLAQTPAPTPLRQPPPPIFKTFTTAGATDSVATPTTQASTAATS